MELNKIKTYINFAIRSGAIIYGVDDIVKSKLVKLIVVSDTLSENSKQKLEKYIINKKVEKLEIKKEIFNELLQNESIKIFAITDANLAKAVNVNLLAIVRNGRYLE